MNPEVSDWFGGVLATLDTESVRQATRINFLKILFDDCFCFAQIFVGLRGLIAI